MQPVRSSAIAAIEYRPEDRRLVVSYVGGATYTYAGVPGETWEALLAAESKGRFVNQKVKPRYAATRLTGRSGSSPRSAA